ncbi:hypothetical protein E2C01_077598 [Portunus trituberculatus]|uniref:Uncharacterized protein n=1 Tax=Portunus trituberculatus TaxID=210409 RepID=A0A5B7ILS0_PORTR|nr:hypothetical protein [Portunus trituberculatus]
MQLAAPVTSGSGCRRRAAGWVPPRSRSSAKYTWENAPSAIQLDAPRLPKASFAGQGQMLNYETRRLCVEGQRRL